MPGTTSLILLSMPSGYEWLLIVAVILLFFGAKRLPGLARGIGKSMREFKDAREGKDETPEQGKDKDGNNT